MAGILLLIRKAWFWATISVATLFGLVDWFFYALERSAQRYEGMHEYVLFAFVEEEHA